MVVRRPRTCTDGHIRIDKPFKRGRDGVTTEWGGRPSVAGHPRRRLRWTQCTRCTGLTGVSGNVRTIHSLVAGGPKRGPVDRILRHPFSFRPTLAAARALLRYSPGSYDFLRNANRRLIAINHTGFVRSFFARQCPFLAKNSDVRYANYHASFVCIVTRTVQYGQLPTSEREKYERLSYETRAGDLCWPSILVDYLDAFVYPTRVHTYMTFIYSYGKMRTF